MIGLGLSLMGKLKPGGLGPESLVNGDFNAGAASWTVSGADATHIATFTGTALRYQSDTTTPSLFVSQMGVVTLGKLYRLVVVCSSWTSGTLDGRVGNTPMPTINGVGTFTADLVCAGNTNVVLTRFTANVDMVIDSISVKELTA